MKLDHPIRRINVLNLRRGVALVAVLVVFAISLTLFGLWAKAGIRERQRIASQQLRMQTERLAEAGLRRAQAQRAANPQYEDETWSVPAEALGNPGAAEVRIRVLPAEGAAAVRYEVTAVFPIGIIRHAEITEHIEIPNPTLRGEP